MDRPRPSTKTRPISTRDFFALRRYLKARPCHCDNRNTLEFLKERGLDSDAIVPWLRLNHGYCDCEVVSNVQRWLDLG